MDISDGFMSLLDPETNEEYSGCPLPEGELGDNITSSLKNDDVTCLVTVIRSMGKEAAISFKEAK